MTPAGPASPPRRRRPATLVVAARFQPAPGVQALVDRRFNRRHYDIAQTVEAFSARLREQVDLDTLSAELLTVAQETMQPSQVSLCLRPRPTGRPTAVAHDGGASHDVLAGRRSPAR
jgi:hypothetical protein